MTSFIGSNRSGRHSSLRLGCGGVTIVIDLAVCGVESSGGRQRLYRSRVLEESLFDSMHVIKRCGYLRNLRVMNFSDSLVNIEMYLYKSLHTST